MNDVREALEINVMVAITDDGNWLAIGGSKVPSEACMVILQTAAKELGREVVDFRCVLADL